MPHDAGDLFFQTANLLLLKWRDKSCHARYKKKHTLRTCAILLWGDYCMREILTPRSAKLYGNVSDMLLVYYVLTSASNVCEKKIRVILAPPVFGNPHMRIKDLMV